jgi:hypothetical protein
MFCKRKYSVSILDENWNIIHNTLFLKIIPRVDEIIYLDTLNKYFRVMNVVHYINDKHGIFIILKDFYKN